MVDIRKDRDDICFSGPYIILTAEKIMKTKTITLLVILPLVLFSACKKYPVEYEFKYIRSRMLRKPDKAVIFAKRSADFWKKTYDKEYGGFFTVVLPNGDIPGGYGQYYKTTLSQSQVMYAFARAYMLTGNKEYLTYAGYAADFLRNKCYDKKNGGFHTTVDFSGKNIDLTHEKLQDLNRRQKQKWSFIQHAALSGPAALVEATRNEALFDFLIQSRTQLDQKLYDTRKKYEGYYESADYDWRNPRGKGFTPTVAGLATHGLSLYLLTNDKKYKESLVSLAQNITDHIYPTAKERKIGFDEHYDADWNPSDESYIFIGHMLNTAWCLSRTYLIHPRKIYKETAERILHNIYEQAWDDTNGGPYYIADSVRGIVTDDTKTHATVAYGITGGLLNFQVTGNSLYLKMADEAAYFYERHLIDNEYGDVIDSVKVDGKKIPKADLEEFKGSYWKSAYHSIETAYFLYLYGKLYLHKTEATLHYFISKSNKPRVFHMNPIAEDKKLVIKRVSLNGENYSDFDARKRLLNVWPGVEGKFEVTYYIQRM